VLNIDVDLLAHKTRPGQSQQACAIDDMHAVPVDTVRRISCDCGVLGVITDNQQPLSISRKSRAIPSAIRRALVRRDHGCTFPGCCATKFVEGHHLTHWANGGETSLTNLALLCSHHHQLVHEGGYTVERDSDGRLAFYDPRGRYIDPRQAQPDDIDYRYQVHRLQSLGIDEETLWSYSGDRMDYSQAIEGLLYERNKAIKEREALSGSV